VVPYRDLKIKYKWRKINETAVVHIAVITGYDWSETDAKCFIPSVLTDDELVSITIRPCSCSASLHPRQGLPTSSHDRMGIIDWINKNNELCNIKLVKNADEKYHANEFCYHKI
jgi:hypothetical protein